MTSIVFYFQAHQPYRLARFERSDVGGGKPIFDDAENERILRRVAERCYLPMNALLREAIESTGGAFRASFSLSGTLLLQLEAWAPEVLDSWSELFDTGCVELLCETSMHSLAALTEPAEFRSQVEQQQALLKRLFGIEPTAFRNTELILDENVARAVEGLGFEVLLGEGTELLLGQRPATRAWLPHGCKRLALLLRSYAYSDDIAFRFSDRSWPAYPLLADTFAGWLDEVPVHEPFIGLFMDYETFGEHQAEDTGIFEFMRRLPDEILARRRFDFATPTEVARRHPPRARLPIPRTFSWADAERDLSAWLGNPMQRAASDALYALREPVQATGDDQLLATWRRLSTSDHVYYMATKFESDAEVHEYFSPHEHPHAAFVTFMHVLADLEQRTTRALESADLSSATAPASPSVKRTR
ncbi:MAG: alpha-amylase [bacterium]|nr:alpha-amylase [bacterium]